MAVVCSFATLIGWLIDAPLLRGFGADGLPIWPQTALGYTALSFGFLSAIRGDFRTARLLWAIPLAIAVVALIQTFAGLDFGTDRLLFAHTLGEYAATTTPGRPGTSTAVILILLALAGYATRQERWLRDETGSLLASAALALGISAGALLLLSGAEDVALRPFRTSLPSAIVAIALATGFIAWSFDFGWVRLLAAQRMGARRMHLLLPLILLLPLAPTLVEIAVVAPGNRSSLASQLTVVVFNIVIVAMVAYGAVVRVARGQAAMAELTHAVDSATIALIDDEGRITHWSQGCEELYGWTASEAVGQRKYALLRSRCAQPWAPGLPQPTGGGAQELVERRRDGSEIAVLERINRVESSGRALCVLSMTDLSRSTAAMSALREREAQMRSVLATVPDAMVAVDEAGLIAQFSATAESLWGCRADDMIGRDFAMLAPTSERERYSALLAHGDFESARIVEGTGEAADGRVFPVEIRAGLAQPEGGALTTIFFRDVSERRAAEQHLAELNAELAHVSRQSAMSELAADLAHELNQPLSAASNFLAAARMLIEAGEDIGRAAELLKMGSEQTQRAGQIIRRMREFMARGEVDMSVEPVDQTVRDAVALVLAGTSQNFVRVTYSFASDARRVEADRIQVQQVVVNLMRNAMQALRGSCRQDGRIDIAARRIEGDMIEIELADNGPGIDEAIVNQLFTRFVTNKRSDGGMGIGLSISRRIIEAHGGKLSAENRPRGGAIFRFTLPAA